MSKQKAKEILLGAHVSIAGGIDRAPERGRRLGCSAIQLFVKSSNQWKAKPLERQEADSFRKNLEKSRIRVAFGHVSYLPNVASPDRMLRKKSIDSVREELKRADRLGLPFLVLHPGSHMGAGMRKGILAVSDSLNRLLESTAPSVVKIVLETTAGQGTGLGSRFEEIAEMIEKVDDRSRIGVCLDTCHIYAAGYDIFSSKGYREVFREFDRVIGIERVQALHLNDSMKACGSKVDRHTHIGKGCIGEGPFRLLMSDPRFFNIPKVIETPKGESTALDRRNLRLLRSYLYPKRCR
jgi:deoxyribonuclease-4